MLIVGPTDAADPRLALYLGVRDADLVRRRGVFVAEGRLVVERLLRSKRFDVESLLLSAAAYAALGAVLDLVEPHVPVYVVEQEVMRGVTGVQFHQGCLALVKRPAVPVVAEAAAARRIVLLEGLVDPDNVGSTFRNALAFGADFIVLDPVTCDPWYRKAIRTSMGATLLVPFARSRAWQADIDWLRAAGFTIVATTPRGEHSLSDYAPTVPSASKLAVAFGAEGTGLSPAVLGLADVSLHIPMRSGVDSVNVGVASGIVLSRLWASGQREARSEVSSDGIV